MNNQKLVVKLSSARGTKRLGEAPENFLSLKARCEKVSGHSDQFSITYKDDGGDLINVSDDEDLQEAYSVGKTSLGGQLSFQIKQRENVEQAKAELTTIEEKFSAQCIIEEPEVQIDSSTVKATIKQIAENSPSSDSDSSDSELENRKRKGHKKGKRNGMPKKVFKKLIQKELEKQTSQMFQNMPKASQQESEIKDGQVVHQKCECDGCGKFPIVGARYKCSVCKNFDYCTDCEETKKHDHPFLKINHPDQVPASIFCVINEDTPNAKTDGDINANQASEFWKNGFPFANGFPGPPNHHGHGHHGHHGPQGHGQCPFKGPRRGGCGGRRRHQEAFQAFTGEGTKLGEGESQHGPGHNHPAHHWKRAMKQVVKGLHQFQDGRKTWKEKRGLVTVPQEALIGNRGQTIFATVTIRNDTPYPYKGGCSLQSQYQGAALDALKQIVLPIDFPVEGNHDFTMNIPIEVSNEARFTVDSQESEHVAEFFLMKPNGTNFGERIAIKFKVVEKIDESEFFQRAMDIFESLNSQEEGLFDLTVECLKEADNNVIKAKVVLDEKRAAKNAPAEEDLYS